MVFGALVSACAPDATEEDAPAPIEETAAPGLEADPNTGEFEGRLIVYTATFDEGNNENQYFLRSGKDEVRLFFEKDPGLLPGRNLRVRGVRTDEGLRVKSFYDEETFGEIRQSLINGEKYKPRTFAFVLVDIGSGVNITKAEAEKRLFGTNAGDKSVKQYYNEASYGTQDITGSVVGPISYRMTGCSTTALASALKPMVGMTPAPDHYLWYLGSRTTSCGWSGLAEAGIPSRPTNDSWYNGSAGCVVLVQEPGHNFGMMHSSSMTCGTASFADDPDSACTHNEYGDRYDPMGGACNHMNAWQKVFQGWLQKCNGVSVKTSGTYKLQPLELACDGIQVLQIPMPKVRPFGRSGGGGLPTTENIGFYYLELRTARGFDESIRSAPVVQVRVAEGFKKRTDRGRHSWILDMDPATRQTQDGLTAGKSYTDPAGGVSFKVVSVTPDGAEIEVTIPNGTGPSTCIDGITPYDPAVATGCGGLATPSGLTDAGISADAGVAPPAKAEALYLVNADTGMDIRMIEDGATLDLAQLPANLSIRVDTDPMVVGSVIIRIDGMIARTDSTAPYSIAGDMGGKFTPWTLALGAHTVTAIPHDGADGGGRMGEQVEIDFTLIRTGGAPDAGSDAGAGLDGGVRPPDAGVGVGDSGTTTSINPVVGDGGLVGLGDAGWAPPLQNKDDDGCGCRVAGAPAESSGATRAWALSALALGLFVRRRRSRRV